jgi:hypothetical protein
MTIDLKQLVVVTALLALGVGGGYYWGRQNTILEAQRDFQTYQRQEQEQLQKDFQKFHCRP